MSIKARERLLNVLIILGVIALLFVVGYPQYKASQPSIVKIGVDKSYSSMIFYIAQEDTSRPYFALEKIEPEFVTINGDPLQGIKDGLYDIVAVPWYRLLITPGSNGDTVKAFCSIELKSGKTLDGFVVPEKSKIRGLRDLKGKRLGFLVSDEYLVDIILNKMEEDKITKVQKVPLTPEEIVSAFADKKADALFLIDPYRGYMIYKGNKVLFEGTISYYIVPSMPFMAIVMRKNYVKDENRLAAIRLKNAVEATLNYVARNPEIMKRLIVRMNDWPSDGALIMQIRVPDYQRLAEISEKNIEAFQTELVKMGISSCGIKPDEFLFKKIDFAR